eukprot:TRINITY_DN22568_c0_g1_i1.p1 TRINITY_DN22568_c0_g1~~TRINITY_DN22568_c0_g1_i1.p1  ORF type:complete len:434 (+),score=103.91 TRINITY_DN22568_c0_g1_i1:83-1384(+)
MAAEYKPPGSSESAQKNKRSSVSSSGMEVSKQKSVQPQEITLSGVDLTENAQRVKQLKVFREFDSSGDGQIDGAELFTAIKNMGIDLTKKEFDRFIASVDEEGDGEISFQEFCTLSKKLSEIEMKSRGKATRIPRAYLPPDMYLQYSALFQQVAGEDGCIDFQELKVFFANNGIPITPEKLQAIVSEVDDDGSGELEEQEFMVLLIKALSLKRRKIGPDVCNVADLLKEGFAVGEARKIGYDCKALIEAGVTLSSLMSICGAEDLRNAGYTAKELIQEGWDCVGAREAQFTLPELVKAGATVQRLRAAGFNDVPSAVSLKKQGVDALKLKKGGFPLSDLRAAGYSSSDLRRAGFSSDSIRAVDNVQHKLLGLPKMQRQSTLELRELAEKRYLESDVDEQQCRRGPLAAPSPVPAPGAPPLSTIQEPDAPGQES